MLLQLTQGGRQAREVAQQLTGGAAHVTRGGTVLSYQAAHNTQQQHIRRQDAHISQLTVLRKAALKGTAFHSSTLSNAAMLGTICRLRTLSTTPPHRTPAYDLQHTLPHPAPPPHTHLHLSTSPPHLSTMTRCSCCCPPALPPLGPAYASTSGAASVMVSRARVRGLLSHRVDPMWLCLRSISCTLS